MYHRGYFYNNKRCRIKVHCKGGGTMKQKNKKKIKIKTSKKTLRKKRRKINSRHSSLPKTINLEKTMSFKFQPFMKIYENFKKNRKKKYQVSLSKR